MGMPGRGGNDTSGYERDLLATPCRLFTRLWVRGEHALGYRSIVRGVVLRLSRSERAFKVVLHRTLSNLRKLVVTRHDVPASVPTPEDTGGALRDILTAYQRRTWVYVICFRLSLYACMI